MVTSPLRPQPVLMLPSTFTSVTRVRAASPLAPQPTSARQTIRSWVCECGFISLSSRALISQYVRLNSLGCGHCGFVGVRVGSAVVGRKLTASCKRQHCKLPSCVHCQTRLVYNTACELLEVHRINQPRHLSVAYTGWDRL